MKLACSSRKDPRLDTGALQVLQVLEDADSATRMHRRIPCEEGNPQPEKTFTGLAFGSHHRRSAGRAPSDSSIREPEAISRERPVLGVKNLLGHPRELSPLAGVAEGARRPSHGQGIRCSRKGVERAHAPGRHVGTSLSANSAKYIFGPQELGTSRVALMELAAQGPPQLYPSRPAPHRRSVSSGAGSGSPS